MLAACCLKINSKAIETHSAYALTALLYAYGTIIITPSDCAFLINIYLKVARCHLVELSEAVIIAPPSQQSQQDRYFYNTQVK